MIDFPDTPVLNESYFYNGKTWVWDGAGWRRPAFLRSQFNLVGVLVQLNVKNLPESTPTPWSVVNYI